MDALVALGAGAWNLAVVPEEEREAAKKALVESVFKDASRYEQRDFSVVLDELIERKLVLFDDDKRFIVGYEVVPDGDGYYLSVRSIPPQSTIPPVPVGTDP